MRSSTSDSPATAACVAGEVLDVEGVLEAARGMVRRRVERREVVVVELDLRALGDAVAETDEDLDDLARRPGRSGATCPGARRRPGQRDVDGLGGDARSSARGRERPPARLERGLERRRGPRCATLPDGGPLLGRERARGRAGPPVSDPFLPRYATRTASSAARSPRRLRPPRPPSLPQCAQLVWSCSSRSSRPLRCRKKEADSRPRASTPKDGSRLPRYHPGCRACGRPLGARARSSRFAGSSRPGRPGNGGSGFPTGARRARSGRSWWSEPSAPPAGPFQSRGPSLADAAPSRGRRLRHRLVLCDWLQSLARAS